MSAAIGFENEYDGTIAAADAGQAVVKLERQWEGKTIGIGYEVDVEVGQIILTLEPDGEPELSLNISVDIAGVFVGVGDEN